MELDGKARAGERRAQENYGTKTKKVPSKKWEILDFFGGGCYNFNIYTLHSARKNSAYSRTGTAICVM